MGWVAIGTRDAVQQQVHQRRAVAVTGDDLPSVERTVLKELLLVLVDLGVVMPDDVIVGRQQEAASAACRVADASGRARAHHLDDGLRSARAA